MEFIPTNDLTGHIKDLDLLLQNKGYDGYFLTAGGHPGKLTDSLNAYVQSYLNGNEYGFSFPPAVTTYCHWKDDKSDAVQCRFTLDYQVKKGFQIKGVDLECYNRHGFSSKKKSIMVLAVSEIPTKAEVKSWGLELEQGNRRSKGLKI